MKTSILAIGGSNSRNSINKILASYAAFKNIFDWMSRIDKNVWQNKPMLLMAIAAKHEILT
jgi:NAD(P)H-dependent FMN reductase